MSTKERSAVDFGLVVKQARRVGGTKQYSNFDFSEEDETSRSVIFTAGPLRKGDKKSPLPYDWEFSLIDGGGTTYYSFNGTRSYKVGYNEFRSNLPFGFPAYKTEVTELATHARSRATLKILAHLQQGGWGMTIAQSPKLFRGLNKKIKLIKRFVSGYKDYTKNADLQSTIQMARIIKQVMGKNTRLSYIHAELKKGAHSKGRKHVGYYFNKASGEWLEFSFGILPLIDDLNKLAIALGREAKEIRVSRSAMSERTFVPTHSVSGGYTISNIEAKAVCKIAGLLRIENDLLSEAKRLGMFDIIGVLDDIIPGTYAADWFLNYSQYIYARQAKGTYTFTGYVSIYREAKMYVKGTKLDRSKKYWSGYEWKPYKHTHIVFKRTLTDGALESPTYTAREIEKSPLGGWLRNLNVAAVSLSKILPELIKRDKQFKRDQGLDERRTIFEVQGIALNPRYSKVDYQNIPATHLPNGTKTIVVSVRDRKTGRSKRANVFFSSTGMRVAHF